MEKLILCVCIAVSLALAGCGPSDEEMQKKFNGSFGASNLRILVGENGEAYVVEHWMNDLYRIRSIELRPR